MHVNRLNSLCIRVLRKILRQAFDEDISKCCYRNGNLVFDRKLTSRAFMDHSHHSPIFLRFESYTVVMELTYICPAGAQLNVIGGLLSSERPHHSPDFELSNR